MISNFKSTKLYLILFLLFTCIILMGTGCGRDNKLGNTESANTKEIKIEDVAGRTVILNKPAERILVQWSGSGGAFMTVAALTGKEMPQIIVGMGSTLKDYRTDMWNQFKTDLPEIEKITNIGNLDNKTFNTELAIAQKADVAFIPVQLKSVFESEIQPKLEAVGTKIIYTDYHSEKLENHIKTIDIIGKALGKEKRAEELKTFYRTKVENIYDRLSKIDRKKPSVYIETGMKGPSVYGNSYGGTYSWGALVKQVRGDLITDGIIPKQGPVNPELILEKNPDIIMIMGSYWPTQPTSMRLGFDATEEESQKRLLGYMQRSGWNDLSAVKNKRVYSIHHGISREIYDCAVIEYIAKALYPEEFKDINPEGTLKEFYDKFLPFTYKGLWFMKLK